MLIFGVFLSCTTMHCNLYVEPVSCSGLVEGKIHQSWSAEKLNGFSHWTNLGLGAVLTQGCKSTAIHTGKFSTPRQPRDCLQPGLSSTLLRSRVEIFQPGLRLSPRVEMASVNRGPPSAGWVRPGLSIHRAQREKMLGTKVTQMWQSARFRCLLGAGNLFKSHWK